MDSAKLAARPLVAVTILAGVAALTIHGFGNDRIRQALREIARVALILFLLAYITSPLHQLLPSPAPRWLVENRSTIGLYFGISISAHIQLIIALFIDGGWLPDGVNPANLYIAALGLVLAIFMAATSVQSIRKMVAPAARYVTHRVGFHLIWFIYAACLIHSFAHKSPPSWHWLYLPLIGILIFAAALRIAARRRRADADAKGRAK